MSVAALVQNGGAVFVSDSSSLDIAGYLFAEVAARGRFLYREVHTLARYYHWSEVDILALSRERRRRYLALIDRALGPTRQDEHENPRRAWAS